MRSLLNKKARQKPGFFIQQDAERLFAVLIGPVRFPVGIVLYGLGIVLNTFAAIQIFLVALVLCFAVAVEILDATHIRCFCGRIVSLQGNTRGAAHFIATAATVAAVDLGLVAVDGAFTINARHKSLLVRDGLLAFGFGLLASGFGLRLT